jgi:hypothetical protein
MRCIRYMRYMRCITHSLIQTMRYVRCIRPPIHMRYMRYIAHHHVDELPQAHHDHDSQSNMATSLTIPSSPHKSACVCVCVYVSACVRAFVRVSAQTDRGERRQDRGSRTGTRSSSRLSSRSVTMPSSPHTAWSQPSRSRALRMRVAHRSFCCCCC